MTSARPTPIAIVGIGCRFPGGISTPDQLFDFLSAGGDAVREVPADRYALDLHFDPDDGPDKVYVRHAGFLDQDIFQFDPAPFGISPRDADHMDPQQRLLLEVAWEAFEDAGIPIDRLRGSATGVFVGGFMLDSQTLALDGDNRGLVSQHTSTGVTMTVLANRISHTFDLRGPSLTVDTACSASLVATDLACRSLAEGTCDVAVAGGATVILTSGGTLIMCKGRFLAADGRSKAFEASADGYGRGEGAGIVVLKRLDDALRDGDRIYAVIRSTGTNQDGRTDGMAFPNGDAQAALSARVCRAAGIDPAEVAYVEAHGTGTRAGDPIEVAALAKTYGGARRHPLRVGSIKTNIGHLEAGAGVAGLIKLATSIARNTILPQRRLVQPNPEIPFDALGVAVVQEPTPWPDPDRRLAGLNSFGYGGTNAHALVADLESTLRDLGIEAPAPHAAAAAPAFVPVSADSDGALRAHAAQLVAFAEANPLLSVGELAHALAAHRSHRGLRAAVLADDRDELLGALRALVDGGTHPAVVTGRAPSRRRVLWTFTGMGPQWWGMAHELYAADPAFRAAADAADRCFVDVAGWSILAEMMRGEADSRMPTNAIAQPANLVLQIGLIASLRARGVHADGYLGHSVGELAAAYAAGCLDLQQAMTVSYHRSQLQQTVAGRGTMLAAAIAPQRAAELCAGLPVEIAAYNAASSVALAGDREALAAISARLAAEGVFHRMMPVEVAYHSAHMDSLERGFMERLAFVAPAAPTAPLYSTVTGAVVTGAVHDAAYWWANARQPVLLHHAVKAALADELDLLIEIGPQPVLKMAISETMRELGRDGVTLHAQSRKTVGPARLRALSAEVHVHGGTIAFGRAGQSARGLAVPHYPFERQYHWVESEASRARRLGRPHAHPLVQRREASPEPRWTTDLSAWSLRWIRDHRVDGRVVFPGAGHAEALLAAAAERLGDAGDAELVIEDLALEQPLMLVDDAPTTLRIEVDDAGLAQVWSSCATSEWTRHARARLHDRSRFAAPATLDVAALRARLAPGAEPAALYARFEALGLAYSGTFRSVARTWCGDDEVLAELAVPDAPGYRLHPAVLDGAFQALLAASRDDASAGPVVPVAIERVRWLGGKADALLGSRVLAYGRIMRRTERALFGDITLVAADGRVLAEVRGLECRAVRPVSRELSRDEQRWFHGETWQACTPAAGVPRGRWLVIGDDSPSARELTAELCRTASASRLDADAAWPFASAFDHVVLLPVTSDVRVGLGVLAATVQRALAHDPPPRLTVLVRGAFDVPVAGDVVPAQTAVAGMARVAMTEHPQLGVRVLDLPIGSTPSPATIAAVAAGNDEEELAVTSDGCFARRIVRTGAVNQARREARIEHGRDAAPVELVVGTPGLLDTLAFRPVREQPLGADEVEVEVEVASLNFKDAMKAMGMLSRTALEQTYLGDGLGMEAVGRVVRTGSDVSHVRAGERVYLWRGGCLATRVRAPAAFVFPLDETIDPEEACCRFVFLTAWHGLVDVARVRGGDRVLIHSAAGGVGLAAIQIARQLGADIYATAGTEDKRAYLRSLGIAHVYDSRTLDFADQIRRDTGGQGVDVVLNALAGPAQRVSLELLRDGGRFVEIGKQDIAANAQLSLLPFNRALSFAAVDLDRLSSSRVELCGNLAREVWAGFAAGTLHALPTEVFGVSDIGDAFRRLASGQVIGKVAVDFRGHTLTVSPGLTPATTIRRDATYLVTGGLGGFGLRTARWLVEQGATQVVLASRRGVPSGDDALVIDALRARGAGVTCLALDVSDARAVRAAIDAIDRPDAPLRGVFHSAMLLDDGPLATLDARGIERVCGPKIEGALNLHDATCELALDHFVTYSSVSALVGNPGQAAYAAANAFLDGLAAHRRRRGLPALSVAWGALGETGVVARNADVRRHLESMGLRPLAPGRALIALGRAMEEELGHIGVIDIDWARWRRATAPSPWRRLDELADSASSGDAGGGSLAAALAPLDADARRALVEQRVMAAVGNVLRIAAERLDAQRPLKDYGVDSLMAVELQVALEQATSVEFSTMELLAGRSLRSLADRVLAELAASAEGAAADTGEHAAPLTAGAAVSAVAVADTAEIPADPAALRAHLLDRICVQEPYFALDGLHIEGEWLHARAEPARAPEVEVGAIGIAEAARHLAILGSCAVRLHTQRAGRIYYPVQSTRLVETMVSSSRPLEEVHMRARCVRIDAQRSEAIAVAELIGPRGERIACFELGYHVIPEAQFQTMFAARARPTDEASGVDPYADVLPIPAARRDGDALVAELGPIDPQHCLGHFVGYPAYPVSIMARDAVQLVAAAVRRREACADILVRVVGGSAGTARFVFAGQRATLSARPDRDHAVRGDTTQRWRVEIHSEGELCAWFDMEIALVHEHPVGAWLRKLDRAAAADPVVLRRRAS